MEREPLMRRSARHSSVALAAVIALTMAGTMAVSAQEGASGGFVDAPPPLEGRMYHTSTLLPDGRILVVGGGLYEDPAPLRPRSGTR